MRLSSAHVRMFKSITDSGPIRFEKKVTCLVGKNEAGKTAVLEALYRLNPLPSGRDKDFELLRDYPRRKKGTDRNQDTVVPIEAEFVLDEGDIEDVDDAYGKDVLGHESITIRKNYKNQASFSISVHESVYIDKLLSATSVSAQVTGGATTLADLRKNLAAIAEPSDAVKGLASKITSFDLGKDIMDREIEPVLPKFLFFDEYSTLPGRISIPYLQATAEEQLGRDERTALALLRLAGVATTEFTIATYESRKASLEAAQAALTDEVFEFWSQNKDLRVQLDVDFSNSDPKGRSAPTLEIRIWNDRHRISLNVSERSRGFLWFFSFLAYFSEFRRRDDPLVLLLDEPGLGLHAAAQADLLRFIDERLALKHQVIYTTHSPFMIKPTELQRCRVVEDKIPEGTVVSEDILSVSRETTFPLQGALGYDLAQTLFIGPDNLLLEGPGDLLYVQIMKEHLRSLTRPTLDERWVLVPAGGVDKIPTFIALLGSKLNVAVIIDVTSRGNQRIEDMIKKGILEPKKFIPLSEITGTAEADIEDMFEPGFYLELVAASGIAVPKLKDLAAGPRILKRLETSGVTFDHYQPAYHFLRHQETLLKHVSDVTLDRFQNLFEKASAAL